MIYKDRMMTEYEYYRYNFRILKLVTMLYKLKVIDSVEMANHILAIDHTRPVGVQVDYTNFRVGGNPDGTYYQF